MHTKSTLIAKFVGLGVILVLVVVPIGWVVKRKMQTSKDEHTLTSPPVRPMIHSANFFVVTNKFVPRHCQPSPVCGSAL